MPLTKDDINKITYQPPPVQRVPYTVKSIYQQYVLDRIDPSYDVIGFYPPAGHEGLYWLGPSGNVYDIDKSTDTGGEPRLILQKKKILKSVVYHVIDRDRPAKVNEFYSVNNDAVRRATFDHSVPSEYIYRREEVYS